METALVKINNNFNFIKLKQVFKIKNLNHSFKEKMDNSKRNCVLKLKATKVFYAEFLFPD